MKTLLSSLAVAIMSIVSISSVHAQATLGAPYVIAEGSQLHTRQIFGSQPAALLDQVDAATKRLGGRLVKLHIAAKDNATVEATAAELNKRYAQSLPAVTCVVGNLHSPEAKLAIDAVIAFLAAPNSGQRVYDDEFGRILYPGSRVYVSGQAEKDRAGVSATLGTLQSLKRSIEEIGSRLEDVVQVKAFLNPIDTDQRVRAEMESFFGHVKVPVVIVEWSSSLPIEIEMIAACPPGTKSSATKSSDTKSSDAKSNDTKSTEATSRVDYLTPLGMTASPIYARMARVHSERTIYIGGLTARGSDKISGKAEVQDIFASMRDHLKQSGSDFRNLVKATYYCANDETSQQLNALRPDYYDAERPPAASKAIVAGVGRSNRFITIDMIAAP